VNRMILRTLGLRTQELAAGPYRFLLSDSIPVAYHDGEAWVITDTWHNKATTKRINRWLYSNNQQPGQQMRKPQTEIGNLFESLDRYTQTEIDRRQGGRRELDHIPPQALNLAEAIAGILKS
jgi:hypothetical protein